MMDIEKLWERLYLCKVSQDKRFAKYKCRGANEDEIDKIELSYGVTLPKSFRNSLRICNGELIVEKEDEDMSTWFGNWHVLLDTEEMLKIRELLADSKMFIKEKYNIDDVFIPFMHDNYEYFAILSSKGEVYLYYVETNHLAKWADS